MLSVKQGGIKYHFLSLWYDSTWDWTQVSRAIGEHSIMPMSGSAMDQLLVGVMDFSIEPSIMSVHKFNMIFFLFIYLFFFFK